MPDPDKPRIYIETTIPGYLVAQPSQNLTLLYHQTQTKDRWIQCRHEFAAVISPEVLLEISRGDPEMAARRLLVLRGIPVLALTEPVIRLNRAFTKSRILPPKAASDILQLAFAAGHGCPLLVTWNCRHINNPFISDKLRVVCERESYLFPTIATPTTLLGASYKPSEFDELD